MRRVVFVRHGESLWNKQNRFTGWTDVPLTERGVQEAINAGRLLREQGFTFDVTHTSLLNRAIKSLWLILEEMDLMWLPVVHTCASTSDTTAVFRGSTRQKRPPSLENSR